MKKEHNHGTMNQQESVDNIQPTGGTETKPTPVISAKLAAKEQKQRETWWNTTATRKEVAAIASKTMAPSLESMSQNMELLYVSVQSIIEVLIDRGVLTLQEIEEKGNSVIDRINAARDVANGATAQEPQPTPEPRAQDDLKPEDTTESSDKE